MTVKYFRPALVALFCGYALTVGAGQADAHAVLVSAQPAEGSTVHSGPSEVRLVFDDTVASGFTDVEVVGPGNSYWAAGPPTIAGDTVSAPVDPLGPRGGYTIRYQIVSDDGHPVSGQVGFTLAVAGTGHPAAGPIGGQVTAARAAASTPSDSPDLEWLWLAGAAVVAVALGLSVARRLRGAGVSA
ncbi:MAG TPA: copper resistance CopC family protein [Pseudonocardiaceae bacterium]